MNKIKLHNPNALPVKVALSGTHTTTISQQYQQRVVEHSQNQYKVFNYGHSFVCVDSDKSTASSKPICTKTTTLQSTSSWKIEKQNTISPSHMKTYSVDYFDYDGTVVYEFVTYQFVGTCSAGLSPTLTQRIHRTIALTAVDFEARIKHTVTCSYSENTGRDIYVTKTKSHTYFPMRAFIKNNYSTKTTQISEAIKVFSFDKKINTSNITNLTNQFTSIISEARLKNSLGNSVTGSTIPSGETYTVEIYATLPSNFVPFNEILTLSTSLAEGTYKHDTTATLSFSSNLLYSHSDNQIKSNNLPLSVSTTASVTVAK